MITLIIKLLELFYSNWHLNIKNLTIYIHKNKKHYFKHDLYIIII